MESYLRSRTPSQVIKRGYTDEEILGIYSLGRLAVEAGNLRRAEKLFRGLTQVAPDFVLAWLGLAYVRLVQEEYQVSVSLLNRALSLQNNSIEAMLMHSICSLNSGDLNAAGTFLGEIRDIIEELKNTKSRRVDSRLVRLLECQIARFQSR